MKTVFTSKALEAVPNIKHGFFTTEGSFDAVATKLGAEQLVRVHQVHSPDVVTVPAQAWSLDDLPKADALVSVTTGQALAIVTADCGPILFADPVAGVLGAAHAGWRGALAGVIENTVAEMKRLGAKPDNMISVLGPSIHQDSYQVGAEVAEAFTSVDETNALYFRPDPEGTADAPKYRFDLPRFTVGRLSALGIGVIDWVAQDTYTDALFSSYRRATHQKSDRKGRQFSVITRVE